jgi:hypothetical protein
VAPRFISFVGDSPKVRSGFIETAVPGISLEWLLKVDDKRPSVMDLVARVAAEVHRLPTDGFGHLPHHADARAHVLSELQSFDSAFLVTTVRL